MKLLLIGSILLSVLLQIQSRAQAQQKTEPHCFDTTKANPPMLRAAPEKFEVGKDPSAFGTDEKKNDWGQVSGIVNHSIQDLYKKLLDPKTIRNGSDTKVVVSEIENKEYLKQISQAIVIRPVFFITIDWKEDWLFSLKEGTPSDPKIIQVSYQKSEGTSHIKHLCGNILLKQITPTSTAVYLYEEVQADRRSAEDALNGITGTLRTLRQ